MFNNKTKANAQLVAHCYFAKTTGKIQYSNYEKYYRKENQQ